MTKENGSKIEATVGHEDVFDIDKALADKEFVKFLADHAEYRNFDMGDPAFLAKKMGEYKRLGQVTKDQTIFYREVFKNIGIDLHDADERCISDVLYEKATHSPEEIIAKENTMRELTESTKEVFQLEERLRELGGSKEELENELSEKRKEYEQVELAQKMSTWSGKASIWGSIIGNKTLAFFSEWEQGERSQARNRAEKAGEAIDAYKIVKEKYGDFNHASLGASGEAIRNRINEIGNIIDSIEDINKKKEEAIKRFSSAQKEILEGVADFTALSKVVEARIKIRMDVMFKKGDLESLNKAQEFLDGVKRVQESPLGINMAKAYNGTETLSSLQVRLDSYIETQTQMAIRNAVMQTDAGSATFARLEKTLVSFATKEKMGTKDQGKIRDFVISSIIEIRDKLEQTPEDKIKFLFINRILIKLKK
jgi:hypothetical protein